MIKSTARTDLTVAHGDTLEWGTRTYVMGVINVTPDSFSGDGLGSTYRPSSSRRFGSRPRGPTSWMWGPSPPAPGPSP